MKRIHFRILTALMVFAVIFSGCSKDEDENTNPDNNGNNGGATDVMKNYSGSGSKGDLITFAINQTDKTYTVHNETTGNDDNGSYTVKTGDFENIYEVTAGSSTFFAVELADKVLAANFPTGNSENDISFGVSSSLSYLNNSSIIAGDYTWIIMSNKSVDGSTDNKEWGVMTVKSDGTWIKKNYKGGSGHANPGYLTPDLFSDALPLTSGDETGTWTVNGTYQERLDVNINGTSETLTGYVYGDGTSSAFLLDLGTGNGFLLGVKNTNSTFSSIAGKYSFVDVWNTGYKGTGNYTITTTGDVSYNHITTTGIEESGSFSFNQCSVLHNVLYSKGTSIGGYNTDIYGVICGEIMLMFMFNNDGGGFMAYGAGGKI